MDKFHGVRWGKGSQIVTPETLYTEKRARERVLQQLHSGLTNPGIVNSRQNLLLRYYNSTSFILTSGHAYAKAKKTDTVNGVSYRSNEYLPLKLIQRSVPDAVTELDSTSLFPTQNALVLKRDSGELPIIVPVSATSPSYPIFRDPSGNSTLIGSMSEPNIVLLVYKEEYSSPTITVSGQIVQSEAIESSIVAVLKYKDYATISISKTNPITSEFLYDSIVNCRYVPLGMLFPIGGELKEDSIVLYNQYIHSAQDPEWPPMRLRPEYSLTDFFLREDIRKKDFVLESFPSRYVVRRTYNIGSTWSSQESRFGDVFSESVKMVLDSNGEYTGIPNSFFLTRTSDTAGGPFRGLTHFPYKIISLVGSDTKNYTTFAKIVPYKKYVSVGDARGIPANITFTITYGWVNNCEPNIDESTTPDQAVLNQPLEKEMVAVGTRVFTTLGCPTSTLSFEQHFPGEKIFYLDTSGYVRYKQRILVPVDLVGNMVGLGTIYPEKQPSTPSKIQVWVTADSQIVGATATVSVTGYTNSWNRVSETITIGSTSKYEVREGLGPGGSDWVGYYSESKNFYSMVESLKVQSGGGGLYCIIASSDGIDVGNELPVFSVIVDYQGNYKLASLKDLRQNNVSQGLSSQNQETSIIHTDGTLTVPVTAGESLYRGDIVYLKHSDGKAYSALAKNESASVDDLDQVQVLGVVYPRDITAGATGEVLCRGVFGLGENDPMYMTYSGLTPGVIVLSDKTKGNPKDLYDLISYIRTGEKDFIPVVRVIEAFGKVLSGQGGA